MTQIKDNAEHAVKKESKESQVKNDISILDGLSREQILEINRYSHIREYHHDFTNSGIETPIDHHIRYSGNGYSDLCDNCYANAVRMRNCQPLVKQKQDLFGKIVATVVDEYIE